MTLPTVDVVRPERRVCAMPLRRKPSAATAAITRSTTGCWTCGALLTTRETVLTLTPATRATSTMVGLRGGPAGGPAGPGPWPGPPVHPRAAPAASPVASVPAPAGHPAAPPGPAPAGHPAAPPGPAGGDVSTVA